MAMYRPLQQCSPTDACQSVVSQDPNVPRTMVAPRILPPKLGELRSAHSTSRSLNATAPLGATHGSPTHGSPTHESTALVAYDSPTQGTKRGAGDAGLADEHGHGGRKATKRESPLDGLSDAALVEAILKYFYYIEHGVDLHHIAPYREEWLGNALTMVPDAPPAGISQARLCARV